MPRLVSKKQKHNMRSDFDMVFVSVNALSDRDEREREAEMRKQIEEELQAQGQGKKPKQDAAKQDAAKQAAAEEALTMALSMAPPEWASPGGDGGGEGEGAPAGADARAASVVRAGFVDAENVKQGRGLLKRQHTVKFDDKNGAGACA